MVLLVASVVLGILAAIVIGICFALLGLLAKLVGAWLMVLVIPLYLALMLSMYPLMFGVMYYFWRDVCGHARRRRRWARPSPDAWPCRCRRLPTLAPA